MRRRRDVTLVVNMSTGLGNLGNYVKSDRSFLGDH